MATALKQKKLTEQRRLKSLVRKMAILLHDANARAAEVGVLHCLVRKKNTGMTASDVTSS